MFDSRHIWTSRAQWHRPNNKIPTAVPLFSRSKFLMAPIPVGLSCDVDSTSTRNPRWRSPKWKATLLGSCRYLISCHVMSCHGRHLGFDQNGSRFSDPENPEPNMKWIRSPVAEIWPVKIRDITIGAFTTPILGEGEVVERWQCFLYALQCDHCAISDLTIRRNLSSNVCDAQINRGSVGHFGLKFYGVPFEIDLYDVGVCRERTPQLTNRNITFEQFHRMWSRYLNVTDRRTDRPLAVAIGEIAYKRCRQIMICKNERVMF